MPVNWGIEARKWQWPSPVGASLIARFPGCPDGTTLALLRPTGWGSTGRILYVEEGKRLSSISLTIVCSIAQLLITLAVGMAGLLYLRWHLHHTPTIDHPAAEFWLKGLLGLESPAAVKFNNYLFPLSAV